VIFYNFFCFRLNICHCDRIGSIRFAGRG
jgi:hypothetical protein